MSINDNGKKNIFTKLTEKTMKNDESAKYPFLVQRRVHSFNTVAIVFAVFAVASGILTKSLYSAGLGAFLTVLMLLLKHLQTRDIEKHGYDVWRFEVLEYTYLTKLHKRPTGMYAEAVSGPYSGKTCHIALQSQGALPPIGKYIDVYVLGNTEASPIRDVYYIPQYFGIELVPDQE